MEVLELLVTPTTTTERRSAGAWARSSWPSFGTSCSGRGPLLCSPSLRSTRTWCVRAAAASWASASSQRRIVSKAFWMPAVMFVPP